MIPTLLLRMVLFQLWVVLICCLRNSTLHIVRPQLEDCIPFFATHFMKCLKQLEGGQKKAVK